MKLSSIREIKSHFLSPLSTFNVGVARPEVKFPRSIALGVGDGKLVVRAFESNKNKSKMQKAFIETILGFVKSEKEVDVQFVKMPSAIDPMIHDDAEAQENRKRTRPIRLGLSFGHKNITAGTLGCFAQHNGKTVALTNAHVGANCNLGRKGDSCLSPGKYDGGREDEDAVATLLDNVKLKKSGNKVDAAICAINDSIEIDPWTIKNHGKWNGFGDSDLEVGQELQKFGRTTSWTVGRITGLEMDNVNVQYGSDLGIISFSNQIEIVSDDTSYILGGDSGSVSMDKNNRGIGLNFAGNSVQAYANDMREVIKALKLKSVK